MDLKIYKKETQYLLRDTYFNIGIALDIARKQLQFFEIKADKINRDKYYDILCDLESSL